MTPSSARPMAAQDRGGLGRDHRRAPPAAPRFDGAAGRVGRGERWRGVARVALGRRRRPPPAGRTPRAGDDPGAALRLAITILDRTADMPAAIEAAAAEEGDSAPAAVA